MNPKIPSDTPNNNGNNMRKKKDTNKIPVQIKIRLIVKYVMDLFWFINNE